jgi:5-methylcytosine-specific restriction endonuclease McrA
MGTWTFRKTEPSDVQGTCLNCGKNPQRKKSNGKYGTVCSSCDTRLYSSDASKEKARVKKIERIELNKRPYIKYKKGYCECCGFLPQHSCQLDVDHIDGNHSNNLPENLMTLCANCHRIKTFLREDWKK